MAAFPSDCMFRQVTIIGVGLLGGSLGLVLKEKGLAQSVVGIGRRRENLELALQIGAIDSFASTPQEAVSQSDLIVLATPVDTYLSQIQTWGKHVVPGTIVSDVGSVKGDLVFEMESQLPDSSFFVGAHPIAGKEKSGVAHAVSNLFQGARCVVTPTPHTNAQAQEKICRLWEATGSIVVSMDPMVHDWVLGAVSHLPHIAAFSLMHTLQVLQSRTVDGLDLLDFSGGGLRDTTRIAASSPEMWRDICLANRDNLVEMIDQYIQQLQKFKGLVKEQDVSGLVKNIEQAKKSREGLV